MKLNKLFMLGLAGLAFAACTNDDVIVPEGDDSNKTMIVSIAGLGVDTRANEPGDKWSKDNDAAAAIANIDRLTLFFTDANGIVKYKYEATKPVANTEPNAEPTDDAMKWSGLFGTSGVKFIGLNGVTAVHAIANYNTNNVNKGGNINDLTTVFASQGLNIAKSGVIYVGSDIDITPFTPEPATPAGMPTHAFEQGATAGQFYYSAAIKLKPIISRIQINSIKVKSSGFTTFGPADDADKYTLSWLNFKPVLNGIYLNNISGQFNNFLGTCTTPLLKNTTYLQHITEGKWLLGSADYTADAAYVKYTEGTPAGDDTEAVPGDYGTLLNYGTGDQADNFVIDDATTTDVTETVAFNIFVPFDVTADTPAEWAAANNPTIHFQFEKEVTGYITEVTLTDDEDATLSDADKAFIATADKNLSYKLPEVAEGGYLFANVSKLYSVAPTATVTGTELQLKAGYIYNMDVEISPVNMTVDLDNPKSYNVVVKVSVLPFNEQTIYPGLGE